ncbi:hypothetical protein [Methylobacterium durans]|uniref:hypothetical protein n=1 Tax=Methylobacterium durans TaxID=2202825 RepID=UPI0013A5B7E6|nr:hypothetical protein [Methylobacterium durans]
MPLSSSDAQLSSAQMELAGNWSVSSRGNVLKVVEAARAACLSGFQLFSDRQPAKLVIDGHNDGGITPPSIWWHTDRPDTACIIVDVGENDWSRLAYQFGHELGHVLCNSWQSDAKSAPPCQWVEEVLVEAFSIHGLDKLATNWALSPVIAGAPRFSEAIREYRLRVLMQHGDPTPVNSPTNWFKENRREIESQSGLSGPAVKLVCYIVEEIGECESILGDLGALNRWPARSATPLEEYLSLWEASCRELGTSGALAQFMRNLTAN